MHKISRIFFAVFLLYSCRETRSISSTEFSEIKQSEDLQISDAEARRMLDAITARIERGEDISASMTKIIQMVMAQQGPDYVWKGLQLNPATLNRLEVKRATYLAQYKSALDDYGFVSGCDGLLFTSLLVASGLDHDLSQAESIREPGQWHRSVEKDCLETGQSASTISRDMILGLGMGLWRTADAAAIRRILQYSQLHQGQLGKAIDAQEQASRVTMSPSLLTLLSEMNFQLSGESSENRGYVPELGERLSGFEAHLQVLRLLLKASLYGGLIKTDFLVLEKLAQSQPDNSLFAAAYHGFTDGDGGAAAATLLDARYFPDQTLPSTDDRCEAYLWQRDQKSEDWQACSQKSEIFPAVDFFWSHAILTQEWKLP